MANVKFIRDALYQLRKDYGITLKYGVFQQNVLDYDTGLNTVIKTVHTLRGVIQYTTKLSRQFVQDIAYLAANKNFTYGALFDQKESMFIIDKRIVPRNVTLELDNFFFLNHQRLVIKNVEILEHDLGWLVVTQTHEGANPFEVMELAVKHTLMFQQEILRVD